MKACQDLRRLRFPLAPNLALKTDHSCQSGSRTVKKAVSGPSGGHRAPKAQKAESHAYSAENRPFGLVETRGFEPPTSRVRFKRPPVLSDTLSVLTSSPPESCTESCTSQTGTNPSLPSDLATLVQAWNTLPGTARARILGIIEGVTTTVGGGLRSAFATERAGQGVTG